MPPGAARVYSVDSAQGGYSIGDGQPGAISMQLREHLVGIQTGQEADPHGWMHRLG